MLCDYSIYLFPEKRKQFHTIIFSQIFITFFLKRLEKITQIHYNSNILVIFFAYREKQA